MRILSFLYRSRQTHAPAFPCPNTEHYRCSCARGLGGHTRHIKPAHGSRVPALAQPNRLPINKVTRQHGHTPLHRLHIALHSAPYNGLPQTQ
ncbi:hypothetical protein HK27_05110 [Acetobacter orientalis]|nr:hypothetical protein HK27_05110 [Acetobacter orientalis]